MATFNARPALFFLFVLPSQLRLQILDFPRRVRPQLRFFLAAISAWMAAAFGSALATLPADWLTTVAGNIFTPHGAWVATMIFSMALMSFGLGVLSAKIARGL